jgi:protein dithiol oxidoreductase (disulfide-forming)
MHDFRTRRTIVIGMCSAPLIAPLDALAQGPTAPRAGADYTVLERPQAVESGDKIEILEFFQYSCPHCYAFTPNLNAWRKHLAPDVDYRRVPLAYDPSLQAHVQLYFTLDALNRVEQMHEKVFAAFHVNHRQLSDSNDIADFMASNGIDRAVWLSTFNSFSVATKVARARATVAAYEITGTPTMACAGKYLTAPSMIHIDTGGDRLRAADMARNGSLAVLDYLIERERRERGGKKK